MSDEVKPFAWAVIGDDYEYATLLAEHAGAVAEEEGGIVVPLYRSPTLTEEERLNRCQAENARLREEAAAMTAAMQQVSALIEKGQKRHYDCEDSWYACPLSEGGCANPAWDKTDCTCGASQYNEILDAVAATIRTWQ